MRAVSVLMRSETGRILLLSSALISLFACGSRSALLGGDESGGVVDSAPSNPVNPPFVRSFDGAHDVEPTAVATDQHGNIYLAGTYNGRGEKVTLAGTEVDGHSNQDIFVAKLDLKGKMVWLTTARGHISGVVRGIEVDSTGRSYVTGNYSGELTLGVTTLAWSHDQNFLASLDASGGWDWAYKNPFTWGGQMFVGPGGELHLGGYTSSQNTEFNGYPVPGNTIILAKIDAQGSTKWLTDLGRTFYAGQSLPESSTARGYFIGIDADGTSYVMGEPQPSGQGVSVVASVDPYGVLVETVPIGQATAVATDSDGNLFTFNTPSYSLTKHRTLTKIDSQGRWLWEQSFGPLENILSVQVLPGIGGEVYLVGYFLGDVVFGDTSLATQGLKDVYVVKIGPSGSIKWVRSGGGTKQDMSHDATVDQSGRLIIVGVHRGGRFAETDLPGSEHLSGFIWALEP